jgi:hypothetical protein
MASGLAEPSGTGPHLALALLGTGSHLNLGGLALGCP